MTRTDRLLPDLPARLRPLAAAIAALHLVVLLLGAAHAWGHADHDHGTACAVCRVVATGVATVDAPVRPGYSDAGRPADPPAPSPRPATVFSPVSPARGPPCPGCG